MSLNSNKTVQFFDITYLKVASILSVSCAKEICNIDCFSTENNAIFNCNVGGCYCRYNAWAVAANVQDSRKARLCINWPFYRYNAWAVAANVQDSRKARLCINWPL